MDGVLSQEEISALLSEPGSGGATDAAVSSEDLSEEERDTIGEVANISMGTAATTLFSLVGRKVEISTPVVTYATWEDIQAQYERPCVFIRIAYTQGLDGNNLLVLKEEDVKVITDLMMGGDGTNTDGEISELHLSAISEAMNQMMGSAATSLSSMLDKMIDISPPEANLIDLTENVDEATIDAFLKNRFVKISFRMEIDDLVDSEIMQLYPISFAKEMCAAVRKTMEEDTNSVNEKPAAKPNEAVAQTTAAQQQMAAQAPMESMQMQMQMGGQPVMSQPMPQPMPMQMAQPMMGQPMMAAPMMGSAVYGQPMNVQQAQFSAFSGAPVGGYQPENIDLIMDVPLEVTVELGRTSKSISDILDFGPGKIIELNRIAGEPIDVLVNGKNVARGEVVVIEENFGVRITEIVNNVRLVAPQTQQQ